MFLAEKTKSQKPSTFGGGGCSRGCGCGGCCCGCGGGCCCCRCGCCCWITKETKANEASTRSCCCGCCGCNSKNRIDKVHKVTIESWSWGSAGVRIQNTVHSSPQQVNDEALVFHLGGEGEGGHHQADRHQEAGDLHAQ